MSAENGGPEIAVVISTRNRETRLAFTLDALAAQTLDRERFEVIVVRSADAIDGSLTDAPDGLSVRFLVSDANRTAPKRNLGWRAARAPIVAFTDDDCRPHPGWLEAMLAAKPSERRIVQGRTDPDPHELHLLHGLARTVINPQASGWYETCNIAYSRALLERLGGFDESIDFLGDDTDLGIRARRAGAGLLFADRALVWHAVHWRSLRAALRDARGRGTWPAVIARYPELRERLWLGVFAPGSAAMSPTHARLSKREHGRLLLALAGAGLALATRSPVPALAAVPYLREGFDLGTVGALNYARLPFRVGARALVGATEIAACAVASVRHRTLVL